ncbi:hypothetical protein DLJ46_00505, partial [Micromonospora globispora]
SAPAGPGLLRRSTADTDGDGLGSAPGAVGPGLLRPLPWPEEEAAGGPEPVGPPASAGPGLLRRPPLPEAAEDDGNGPDGGSAPSSAGIA